MKAILTDKSKLNSIRSYLIWKMDKWYSKTKHGEGFVLNKVISGATDCDLVERKVRGAGVRLKDGNTIYRKNVQLVEG